MPNPLDLLVAVGEFLAFDPIGVALISFLICLSLFFFWAAFKGEDDDGGLGPLPVQPRWTPPTRRRTNDRGGPTRKHDRGPRLPTRTKTRV